MSSIGEGVLCWGGRDTSGFLTLLEQPSYADVMNIYITGEGDSAPECWERLATNVEIRGSRYAFGLYISTDLGSCSPAILGRLVQSAHCVEIMDNMNMTLQHGEVLLSSLGSPESKARHVKLSAEFAKTDAVTAHLKKAITMTSKLVTTEKSFSRAQLREVDWSTQGVGRGGVAACSLPTCGIVCREEEHSERVEGDFLFLWRNAFGDKN